MFGPDPKATLQLVSLETPKAQVIFRRPYVLTNTILLSQFCVDFDLENQIKYDG